MRAESRKGLTRLSIITILWSFVAAIGLSCCIFQLALWRNQRGNFAPLLAATMALAAGAAAMCELSMAKAASVESYQLALLVFNAAIFMLLIPMIWFVRLSLDAGPRWIALAITAIWVVCIFVNFMMPGNLTFTEIERLDERIAFWGEPFFVPIGTANPLRFLSEIATVLIIIFAIWAIVVSTLRGKWKRALFVGGPVLLFIVTAGAHTVLVDLGIVKTPYMISWAFMAIAIALGADLVAEASSSIRKSAEIARGEERWLALIEHVDLGIIGLSSHGAITFANPAMLKLLGRSQETLIGQPIIDFVPPALREDLGARIKTAREIGPRPRTEYPLVDAEGMQHDVVWSIVATREVDAEITGFMAICDDVTEGRKLERDLRETRQAIEKLDRSAALAEITAGIAHEINQPLAAILSNAQAGRHLINRDPVPSRDIAEILDDIVEDNKRAKQVIVGVRNLLSPQQGSMSPADFTEISDDISRIIMSDLVVRGINLDIRVDAGLPQVLCNKVQIEQVLLNLILNAAKAQSEAGTVTPRIEIIAKSRQSVVSVFVCDNGPGINPDVRQDILQPGVTTRQDGLGMGLTIAQRIIENHGGAMGFSSKPGEGTVFRFTLPLAELDTTGA